MPGGGQDAGFSRRLVFAGVALATVLSALPACERARSAKRSSEQAAIEGTVRAFELATGRGDAEQLLRMVTDGYVKETFGSAGASAADVLASPDEFLGRRIHRRVESIGVAGGRATVEANVPAGSATRAHQVVQLTKEASRWKVDHIRPATSQVATASHRIDVEMKDFSFKFDPGAFRAGVPLEIRITNSGLQPHMMALWRITLGGKPIKLIESTDTPPGKEVLHGDPFRPSEEGDFSVKGGLKPGRYLMVCLLGDVTTPVMTPHYDRGMVNEFQVSKKSHMETPSA